jgi:hypothetical protein
MQRSLLRNFQVLLDTPFIRRVRRNHGLEHGTIHLLAARIPKLRMVGRSDTGGFWLIGEVETEDVIECAHGALERMRNGEHQLALHPNCGTNLVTLALLGTASTFVALAGSERQRFGRLQRLPMVAIGLMMAAIFSQPLGMRIQEHITTLGDPADLEILSIKRMTRGGMTTHRVATRSS